MSENRIHISIGFGDVILPVIDGEDGHKRVPLKPVCDQIGVDWKTQKRKLINDDYLTDRFGLISGEDIPPEFGQLLTRKDQYLIRFDRVTAFLNTLNPQRILSHGNVDAAEWLKQKHQEWDDVLHQYEKGQGTARTSLVGEIVKLINARDRTSNTQEQAALTALLHQRLAEEGSPVGDPRQTRLGLA